MGKKRSSKNTPPVTLNAQGQAFDYKKLAEAIVHAQQEAEVLRKNEQEKLSGEQQQEWLNALGQKTYKNENCITKILHRWRNNIVAFFKIMFLSRKEAQGDKATFGILQFALALLFSSIRLLLFLLTIGLIVAGIYSFEQKAFAFSFIPLLYALPSIMLGRIFRIAGFEIEKMTDRNYLLSILSAVTALIAMILALVALFVR